MTQYHEKWDQKKKNPPNKTTEKGKKENKTYQLNTELSEPQPHINTTLNNLK